MVELVSRETWGAAPSKRPISDLQYPVGEVFVHHEGGPTVFPSGGDDERSRMRSFQKSMQARYSDIPYSVCVFPSGRAYEGRDLDDQEAATAGRAGESISICVMGNYNLQNVTAAAITSIADVIQLAELTGRVVPLPQVLGHQDVRQTACPGTHLYQSLPSIRALVRIRETPVPSWEDDVPKPTDVVAALSNVHGAWKLLADGSIHTLRGAFWGAYPALPAKDRQGVRYFTDLVERVDAPHLPGYSCVANDGAIYTFGQGIA